MEELCDVVADGSKTYLTGRPIPKTQHRAKAEVKDAQSLIEEFQDDTEPIITTFNHVAEDQGSISMNLGTTNTNEAEDN